MTDHDETHMRVVDSYVRSILLHQETDASDIDAVEDELLCPYNLVPDELWPCVDGAILALLQTTLEYIAEREGVTYQEEVDSWLGEREAG